MIEHVYISEKTSNDDIAEAIDGILRGAKCKSSQAYHDEVSALVDRSRELYRSGSTVNISKSIKYEDLTIHFHINFPERLNLLDRVMRTLSR